MEDLKAINNEAYDHLLKQNPRQWSRAFFQSYSCSDAVENNMCETFNGFILEARQKPIIHMLEDIRIALMVRMQKKKDDMLKWTENMCPNIRQRLEESKGNHRFWQTTYNRETQFEVKHGLHGYVVDCKNKTCSCRMWQLSGIPCPHAVSAIYYMQDDPDNYVADWYMRDAYANCYNHSLQAQNGEKMWRRTNLKPFLPPTHRRMPGRPKKARRKEINEEPKKKSWNQISRVGRKMKCTKCGNFGHNKKTCKSPTVEQIPTIKGKLAVRKSKGITKGQDQGPSIGIREGQDQGPSTPQMSQTGPPQVVARRSPRLSKGKKKETTTTSHPEGKGKDKVPEGFGVYISPDTGNSFLRLPGQKSAPVQLNKGNPVETQRPRTIIYDYRQLGAHFKARNQVTSQGTMSSQPMGTHSIASQSSREIEPMGSQATRSQSKKAIGSQSSDGVQTRNHKKPKLG